MPSARKRARKKVQQGREKCNRAIQSARDRRRKTRKNLEDVFGRKTFMSVAVLSSGAKVVETIVVPTFIAYLPVINSVGRAWTAILTVSLLIAVYWHKLAATAEEVGDTIEEATDATD